jgi:hypothetical protein
MPNMLSIEKDIFDIDAIFMVVITDADPLSKFRCVLSVSWLAAILSWTTSFSSVTRSPTMLRSLAFRRRLLASSPDEVFQVQTSSTRRLSINVITFFGQVEAAINDLTVLRAA